MNFCSWKVHKIHLSPLMNCTQYFLEIMPLSAAGATTMRRGPKTKMQDHFAAGNKDENADEGEGGGDIIMNEDGTMYAAGNADSEDEL